MTTYCRACAEERLKDWRGVPWRNLKSWGPRARTQLPSLPGLPKLVRDRCPKCGGDKLIEGRDLAYVNVHGEYNTGLPDYWVIEEVDAAEIGWFHERFGHPYPDDFEDQNRRPATPRTKARVNPVRTRAREPRKLLNNKDPDQLSLWDDD